MEPKPLAGATERLERVGGGVSMLSWKVGKLELRIECSQAFMVAVEAGISRNFWHFASFYTTYPYISMMCWWKFDGIQMQDDDGRRTCSLPTWSDLPERERERERVLPWHLIPVCLVISPPLVLMTGPGSLGLQASSGFNSWAWTGCSSDDSWWLKRHNRCLLSRNISKYKVGRTR